MEKHEIESYRKAGDIIKAVKKFAFGFVKRDMLLYDIVEAIEGKIRELGAEVAFPVNLSLNEIAAHYTPKKGDEYVAVGLLKIDMGACVDGYIADSAISIDLTDDSRFKDMIELNKKLLEAGSKVVSGDVEVRDVGNAISKELDLWNMDKESNFTIVHGLTGHGLGKDLIHTSPNIPNYSNDNARKLNGMAFAIEPFVTAGSGEIYEGEGGNIYSLRGEGRARDRDARKILDFIKEKFKTRPFCARWLEKEGFSKIYFSLNILVKQGILHHYPLLIERTKAVVSQYENSFIVDGDLVECFTG